MIETQTSPPRDRIEEPPTEAPVTAAGMSGAAAGPYTAPLAFTADDAEKARQLAVMKRRASGLLVVFAVLFVVTKLLEARWPWLAAIRATAEAAMVGGLADWFAVTALFRQPLGLPIPHTAIVKTRKERIGRSLGNFVQHNFLARPVIARHLAGLHVATRLAEWGSHPDNARRVARQIAGGLARAVDALPDEEVREAIHSGLVARGRRTQVAPILGDVLSLVAADGRHQVLLDQVLRLVDRFVEENKDLIRERIATESPWWVPTAIDDKVYEKIVNGVERMLDEVRAQPDHPMRAQFDRVLMEFIESLHASPEVIARAEAMKEDLLTHPAVREYVASLWSDAKAALARYAEGADGGGAPAAVERGLVSLGNAMLADTELVSKVDGWITDAVLFAVEQYRDEVRHLIESTVAAWDPIATSQRIELQIGKDLQFIRINGTLVGGLVGLGLYVAGKFL